MILEVDLGLVAGLEQEEAAGSVGWLMGGLLLRESTIRLADLRLYSVLKPYFSASRLESMNWDLTKTRPLLVEWRLKRALISDGAGTVVEVMVVEREALWVWSLVAVMVAVVVVVVVETEDEDDDSDDDDSDDDSEDGEGAEGAGVRMVWVRRMSSSVAQQSLKSSLSKSSRSRWSSSISDTPATLLSRFRGRGRSEMNFVPRIMDERSSRWMVSELMGMRCWPGPACCFGWLVGLSSVIRWR